MKNKRGVTLIALIVTIIILLILAGVTLRLLTGNEGILKRAENARKKSDKVQEIENATLEEYDKTIKEYLNNDCNDFEKWISYVKLENKYESISELLNSQDFSRVLDNKECVDFMLESTETILPEIMKSENAIREIGKNNDVSNQIIENETWLKAIEKSQYADVFDESAIKIPILTDNTSNGIVTGSPAISTSYQLYYPFTGGEPNSKTGLNIWCPNKPNDSWIGYEFKREKNIKIYKLKFNGDDGTGTNDGWCFPQKYALQCKINEGDDNNSNWINCSPIFEISDITREGNFINNFSEKRWWSVTNYFKSETASKKFRLYVYKSFGNYVCINGLQIYGRE